MRFSDSTQFDISKPNKHPIRDSSPFNSDESQSDDDLLPKPIISSTTSNYEFETPSSNDSSPIKLHDNLSFKKIIKTHQTGILIDRLRQRSQNHSNLPPPIDRTTKTHYNLKRQPKMNDRLLYLRQIIKTNHSLYWLNENCSMKCDNTQKLLKLSLCIKNKVHTSILDSSSNTSPPAPSLSTNTESQTTTTTQPRNVTPVTASK